jgi:hypothetical protein
MKACGSQPRSLLLAVAIAVAALVSACVWDPWIPGQRNWNPEIVVDPANILQQLALDAPYVDELDCYARRCQKRFRLVVDQPGQLTVSAVLELTSEDEQARIVLEATRGVIAQDGTGRGVRTDVSTLAVRTAVEKGTYFVLIQSIGGRIPYELTATLTPGAGPTPPPRAEPAIQAARRPPDAQPRRFTKVELGASAGGGYDPAVIFSGIRTFTFPRPPRPGDPVPAGTSLETPQDRQIRRFLVEGLELKGFRQASGSEEADLMVAFSTGGKSRTFHAIPLLYEGYAFTRMGAGFEVDTRGTLVVDIIDARSDRLAWHAWTTKGIGPGITHGARTTALLREAVADVLVAFPPH